MRGQVTTMRARSSALQWIQAGSALGAFGLGFTVPYLYVYAAQVRGLGVTAAGSVLAAFAVAALLVLPFSGRSIDRRGPVPVLLFASVVAAVGAAGLGFAESTVAAVATAGLLGAGTAVMQPASATLITRAAPVERRTKAFATQFFLQNLALGVGGLLGGQIVDQDSPGSFTLLFLVEAGAFLLLALISLGIRLPGSPVGRPTAAAASEKGGFRALLRHRAMTQLCVLGFVIFFACYGQFESGLSAYGVEAAGITPSVLGFALAANTLMIVLAQFAALRFVERKRRSRVIAGVGLIWAVAWLSAGWAGLSGAQQTWATVAFISTYALFGLGEALLSPTVPSLVVDLAPAGMVGRYNSAFALVKQLALAIGPAVGGPLGASFHLPYIVVFVLISLCISVLALRLGRRLAPAQDSPALAASRVVARSSHADAVPTGA